MKKYKLSKPHKHQWVYTPWNRIVTSAIFQVCRVKGCWEYRENVKDRNPKRKTTKKENDYGPD